MKIERNLKKCLLFFILLFLITNFNKFFQKHTKNIHTYICIRYVYHLNYKNLVAYYALNYKMLQISQVLHEVNIILEVPFFMGYIFICSLFLRTYLASAAYALVFVNQRVCTLYCLRSQRKSKYLLYSTTSFIYEVKSYSLQTFNIYIYKNQCHFSL